MDIIEEAAAIVDATWQVKTLAELRTELEAGNEVLHWNAHTGLSYFKYDGVYYEVNGTHVFPLSSLEFDSICEEWEDLDSVWYVGDSAELAFSVYQSLGMV